MNDETLLAVIYRGRPATTPEFATLAHLSDEDAVDVVAGFRERGLIGGDGERLAYPHPASWAADTVSARSEELRRTSRDALAEMEKIIKDLPGLLQHWSVGESAEDLVPAVTRHGPRASEDLWFDTVAHDSGTLHALLPEVDRFLTSSPERSMRFGKALAGKDAVKVIMPTWAGDDPASIQRMVHYRAAGVEYRLLDNPPSWFWVDGEHFAVPFEWGEGSPTSVLGVRNAAIAGLAREYFDLLWQKATPALPPENSWTPLLVLMRQGVTLDTASRRLGINPRTGRRRIATAMEHYKVSTLFALGVAWAADPIKSED